MILCRGQVGGRGEGARSAEVREFGVTFGRSLQAGCAMISLQVDYFGAEHLHASGADTPGRGHQRALLAGASIDQHLSHTSSLMI